MKKRVLALIFAVSAVAGCMNQEAFVKKDLRYSDYELDRAACETQATQEIPVNRSPGAEIAVALLTGVYQTQDANADARKRNYEACMLNKGYQRVEFPTCPNAKKAKENGVGPLNASARISIEPGSCVARDSSGRLIFSKKET